MAVLSVPILGTELLEYLEPILDSVGTILGGCVIIYTRNYGFGFLGRKWPWISVPQSGTDA